MLQNAGVLNECQERAVEKPSLYHGWVFKGDGVLVIQQRKERVKLQMGKKSLFNTSLPLFAHNQKQQNLHALLKKPAQWA